jgi:RND family efflux transporter MFP subunit
MTRNLIIFIVVVAVIVGGLFGVMKLRAPKPAPPTKSALWAKDGIPVEFSTVSIGDMKTVVPVTGSINALDQGVLSPKISGRVSEVYFRAGDSISVGQVYAILDQSDALNQLKQADMVLQQAISGRDTAIANLSKTVTAAKVTTIQTDATISQAESNLSSAKAQLELAKQPTRTQDKSIAENAVATANAQLENAETEFKRAERLYKEGAVSQSVYDSAKTVYTSAKNNYDSALQQLSMVKEGGRTESIQSAQNAVRSAEQSLRQAKAAASENMLRQEDIKSAKAGVKNATAMISSAKTAIAIAKDYLANTYIKSQVSGQISARAVEPGQVVMPGQAIGTVVNMGSLYFQADLSETDVRDVRKGQPVVVGVDALPGQIIRGTVDIITPEAALDSRKFPVRIKVLGSEISLKPGMYVRGSITTGVASNIVKVSKDAIDERRGTKMVFIIEPKNKVKRIDVEVVRDDGVMAQIKEPTALKTGDKVVTTGRQSLQDGSLVRPEKSVK